MRPLERARTRMALAALSLAAAACSDSLVDHNADPNVLNPYPCLPAQAVCGGACVAEGPAACGASCADCTGNVAPDPHAQPACVAHACAFECEPGWLRSGSACVRARAISAGFAHTCALLDDGGVRCWGANEHGQLGNGSTTDSPVPVEVRLQAPASAVAAGYVHSCAIVAGGAVWCWGDNTTGSLGDGSTTGRTSPVQVVGLAGAIAIAAGGGEVDGVTANTYYGHTCVVVPAGVECWGSNESGQLGNGSFVESHVPVQTSDISTTPTAIAVGDRHTCAVVGGQARCWGADGSKQLGDGATTNQKKPVTVSALGSGVTAIAAGAAHSCAVVNAASNGELWCWGSNSAGQANGVATFGDLVNAPQLVPPFSTSAFSSAAGGNEHTCAVASGGGVQCFGADLFCQLTKIGDQCPIRGIASTPIGGVAALTAGFDHTCALGTDGGVQCWGDNGRGQLGGGAAGAPVGTPTYVSGR